MGGPWWLSEREVSFVDRLISCAVVTRILQKGRDIYQAGGNCGSFSCYRKFDSWKRREGMYEPASTK